jgi:2-desacetyl-2-hydroxyethyl bacteriochlorophyllide A dehydrogenase
MRAVRVAGPGVVEVAEVPAPKLEAPTDAIVRVTLAGICGTDLHLSSGHADGVPPGTRLGHEFVGDVVDVGSHVRRIAPGDHVMGADFTACGACRFCEAGDHWHCKERAFFGTGTAYGPELHGAQAELVRVPHAETTLAPTGGLSDEAAILAGDNLATGWIAVERAGARPGEIVAVLGGGAVGQLVALSALTIGAAAVVLVEPSVARRELAERRGVLAATPEEAPALVRALTDGDGADVVVDAVGGTRVLASALGIVRKRGRIVSVGAQPDAAFALPVARAFVDELTLSFAIGDAIRTRSQVASLLRRHALDPGWVIDGRVPLSEAARAYAELRAQRFLKVVLDPHR